LPAAHQITAMKTLHSPAADQPFPFELVAARLAEVEIAIREQSGLFEPEVQGYIDYIVKTSGKRIRPALAILTGESLGNFHGGHLRLGVVLELIHMATLVHDDIIDGADTRRAQVTANSKWGNALGVLFGDALFAHAMTEATMFDDLHVCRRIGQAAREVCEGEVIQTQRRFDLGLSRQDYFRIIEMKTAALFAAATELAGYLGGAGGEACARLRGFGLKLGTAYQIYDDCIDLVGQESAIGKTLGTDLKKGKLTLPILNLLDSATEAQRSRLNRMLVQQEPIDLGVLAGIADYAGSLEAAVQTGRDLLTQAREDLGVLPENDHSRALGQITRYLEGLLDGCLP
jgi:octaprenyl-diphosphate synthase